MTFSISYTILVKETKESERKRKGHMLLDDSSTEFKEVYVNKASLQNM